MNGMIQNEYEKVTYSFSSMSPEIINQIQMSHPEIYDLFPCHLSRRNPIDKHLMNIIIHGAVKGQCPSVISEIIKSWHHLQWQKKDNQWAAYILHKLNYPPINQTEQVRRGSVEKCPKLFSDEMGGCAPTGSYLIEMFCFIIEGDRQYYDSEYVKRAQSTEILAIDASYKVPKWMMKWGGDNINFFCISYVFFCILLYSCIHCFIHAYL